MDAISRTFGTGILATLGLLGTSQAQEVIPSQTPEPVVSQEIWRDGPPAERPKDEPGPPPGPNLFYVPGEYYPDGDGVAWRTGYWAKEQPGWSWVPAQWSRLSDGWTFREGRWVRTHDPRIARTVQPRDNSDRAIKEENGDEVLRDDPLARRESVTYNIYNTTATPFPYGYGYGYGYGAGIGIAPRFFPSTLYAGYLWNPNLVGWGYPGYGGFGYYGGFARPYGFGYGWPGGGWGGFGGYGFGFGMGFGAFPFLW